MSDDRYHLGKLPDRNLRGAFTIFCDDVRKEVTGKSSIIGVYGPEMHVPDFPFIYPQLSIITTVWTPQTNPFKKLVIRILFNDDVWSEEETDPAHMASEFEKTTAALGAQPTEVRNRVNRTAVYSPFLIEKPGVIRVRVETEDGELRTSSLDIRKAVSSS